MEACVSVEGEDVEAVEAHVVEPDLSSASLALLGSTLQLQALRIVMIRVTETLRVIETLESTSTTST